MSGHTSDCTSKSLATVLASSPTGAFCYVCGARFLRVPVR